MTIALIISLAVNALLLGLLLFLRHRYVKQQDYTRRADLERLAMAEELGELRDAAGFLKFR